jgi:hypothetical protein
MISLCALCALWLTIFIHLNIGIIKTGEVGAIPRAIAARPADGAPACIRARRWTRLKLAPTLSLQNITA